MRVIMQRTAIGEDLNLFCSILCGSIVYLWYMRKRGTYTYAGII